MLARAQIFARANWGNFFGAVWQIEITFPDAGQSVADISMPPHTRNLHQLRAKFWSTTPRK
jgi:hypothetical protein